MSVIVKGMEMPISCASCRMAVCFADTGRAKCYATLSYIDPERRKRSQDCPLRPLPEGHGRLIDADALRGKMYHDAFETDSEMQRWDSGCWIRYKMLENNIDDAETIVEAEE